MAVEDLTTEKLERIRQEVSGAVQHRPRPRVTPQDLKESRADALRGRERTHYDRWRQVMEYHGFLFLTPAELDAHPLVGPMKVPTELGSVAEISALALHRSGQVYEYRGHTEAQWRRFGRYAEAFTVPDLVQLFGDSPERFDLWIRDHTARRHLRSLGLSGPRGVHRAVPRRR